MVYQDPIKVAAKIKFYCDDLEKNLTIKAYLKHLLQTVWIEGESFSGKRPFGNSDWKYNLYAALIKEKFIEGILDEDGYIEECNEKEGDTLILKIIKSL